MAGRNPDYDALMNFYTPIKAARTTLRSSLMRARAIVERDSSAHDGHGLCGPSCTATIPPEWLEAVRADLDTAMDAFRLLESIKDDHWKGFVPKNV